MRVQLLGWIDRVTNMCREYMRVQLLGWIICYISVLSFSNNLKYDGNKIKWIATRFWQVSRSKSPSTNINFLALFLIVQKHSQHNSVMFDRNNHLLEVISTHCGLETPYGNPRLMGPRHYITWTNADFSLERFCSTHLGVLGVVNILFCIVALNIILLKLEQHLTEANESITESLLTNLRDSVFLFFTLALVVPPFLFQILHFAIFAELQQCQANTVTESIFVIISMSTSLSLS